MKRCTVKGGDRIRLHMPDGLPSVEVFVEYVASKVAQVAVHAPDTVGIENRDWQPPAQQYRGDPAAPPRRKK